MKTHIVMSPGIYARFGAALLLASGVEVAAAGQQDGAAALSAFGFRPLEMHRLDRDRLLTVDTKINAQPAVLAIATAAPVSALDRAAAARFGFREFRSEIPVQGTLGRSRSERFGVVHGNSVELANIVIAGNSFAILDERTLGGSAVGVLGALDLNRLAAVIDCGNGRLYLNPKGANKQASETLAGALASRGFHRIPLRINGRRHFEAVCRFNGYAAPVTIETAAMTCISSRTAAQAYFKPSGPGTVIQAVGGLRTAADSGSVEDLSIGSFSTKNARMLTADIVIDVFGLDFLRAHSAVLDLGGKSLYLRAD